LAALYPDQKKLLLQTKEMVCRSLWRLFSFESISKKISVILDPISSIQKTNLEAVLSLFVFLIFNSCQYFDKQIPSKGIVTKGTEIHQLERSRWIPIGSRLKNRR
jgi:hypothetical protein